MQLPAYWPPAAAKVQPATPSASVTPDASGMAEAPVRHASNAKNKQQAAWRPGAGGPMRWQPGPAHTAPPAPLPWPAGVNIVYNMPRENEADAGFRHLGGKYAALGTRSATSSAKGRCDGSSGNCHARRRHKGEPNGSFGFSILAVLPCPTASGGCQRGPSDATATV